MDIKISKDTFQDMENAFSHLKTSEGDTSALRTLETSLHSLTGKAFEVQIIGERNVAKEECVIMSIYPEESALDAIISSIVNNGNDADIAKAWNNTSRWIIEIDRKILTDKANISEKELVALLMHEIGHIVYSNTVPVRICKTIRLEYAKSSIVSKQMLKDTLFSKVLLFPLLHACNANVNSRNIKNELMADRFAVKAGYGKELETAMDKVFVLAGSSNSNTDDELMALSGFSIDSLINLQKRQNKLVRKNVMHMITHTPSRFAKNVLSKFHNNISVPSNNPGSVTESSKDLYIADRISKISDECYTSEFFFNRQKKLKRIDPADIDYIGLEIGNIKSNDDKMMIVTYIYNKLDIIDYYLSILDSKNPRYSVPHSKESLISMRNTLEKYRQDAINYRIPTVDYNINIMYPKGYEG